MKKIVIIFQALLSVIIFSSCQFTNNKGVNNEQDVKLRLHDIWALEAVKGENINLKNYIKHPGLEINLTTNRVMGNDGCNNFSGGIKKVDSNNLSFNALAVTRMACPNMKFSNEIGKYLLAIDSYKIDNLKLSLFDIESNELLRYKKVD